MVGGQYVFVENSEECHFLCVGTRWQGAQLILSLTRLLRYRGISGTPAFVNIINPGFSETWGFQN